MASTDRPSRNVVVDVAGASMGGAHRFFGELVSWRARHPDAVRIVGEGKALTVPWLLRREARAIASRAGRVVALNNVSFVSAPAERVVLVRNALYFLQNAEARSLPDDFVRRLRAQRAVIHRSLSRAHVIVVPTSSMRDRVVARLPALVDRVRVRFHPVSPFARRLPGAPTVVCPVLDAPYKRMGEHVRLLAEALARPELASVRAVVTMTDEEARGSGVLPSSSLELVGRLPPMAVSRLVETATALYFPTSIESFGYPLAEARVGGIPVLAPPSMLATEVAGPALVPFAAGDPDSLAAALASCVDRHVDPDPEPFDPSGYFSELFGPEA